MDERDPDKAPEQRPEAAGSSPGDEATDPQLAQQPFPTPGEEHLVPVDEAEGGS
jgi:hypothetical protein